jgi:hypothetical protein
MHYRLRDRAWVIPREIIAIPTTLRMRANVDVIEEIWIT